MSRQRSTVLIVDDGKVNRRFIRKCLQGQGYRFLEAGDGQQALAYLETHKVDLIILDLMMPKLDGFGVLERLKARNEWAQIPVIINSSLTDLASIRRALTMGCYDYFLKSLPPEEARILLPLKVRNAINAKLLLDAVQEKKAILEREIHLASKYQRFLLPQAFVARGLCVEPWFHPHIGVGGDFFDFVELAEEQTAFIIADVSGHGVLAAMVAAILKPLFAQYIHETGAPLPTLQRLNRDLCTLTAEADYVTAFVAVYDPLHQQLCYANAGHPPPLLWHRATGEIEALTATGLFLGLFPEGEWRGEARTISIVPEDRLLLITDGVTEARAPNTEIPLGVDGLTQVFAEVASAPPRTITAHIWQRLQEYAGNWFADDVTFIAMSFHTVQQTHVRQLPNDPSLVRQVVDEVLETLPASCSPQDSSAIRLSLVEMLMNAIEHGNLAIGYTRKRAALETGTYDELVESRRRLARYAARKVTLEWWYSPRHAVFTIRDQGEGFNWRTLLHACPQSAELLLQGRGLFIARSYMDACWFNGQGNTVTLMKYFTTSRVITPSPLPPKDLTHHDKKGGDRPMHATSTVIDNVPVIRLAGAVDFLSRKTLRTLIDDYLAQGHRDFVLNFQDVTFIDSSGLGALVACYSTIRKQGGTMKLVQLPPQVAELMEMTRLADFFEIHASEEEARRLLVH